MNFCHLHVHSEYSLLDGLGKPINIFNKAKELGQKAISITDHANLDSYVKCIKAQEETGILYIPGCEFYVVDDFVKYKSLKKGDKSIPRIHLTVWAKNEDGVGLIFRLLNIANQKFYYRPLIEWIDLENEKQFINNVIFGSACTSGLLSKNNFDDIERILNISKNMYIEIMPHLMDSQIEINRRAIKASKEFNLPLLATQDCHYINKEDNLYQEVLLAIQSKCTWKDPKRWKFDISDLYMKSEDEMINSFVEQNVIPNNMISESIENSYRFIDKFNFNFSDKKPILPSVYNIENKTDDDILIEHAMNGLLCLKEKYEYINENFDKYENRIKEELHIILHQGFSRYFLIVEDLHIWAKEQGILCGVGRGSVGCSLVAYCLGITAIDPIKYNLIFARFISPARIDLPDIDMDFEDTRREDIKTYLRNKYGENKVAGVSTFSEMHGRGALRDVARVFDIPLIEADAAAKSIVVRSGGDVRTDFSIEDAFSVFEEGKKFLKKYPDESKIAMALEGTKRNTGVNAAGFVISTQEFMAGKQGYLCQRGSKSEYVINWDKEDLEYMGLMKLDILGLNSLTILSKIKQLIKLRYNIDFNYFDLDLNDDKVLESFSSGNTIGIFQFGSYGIRKLCQEIKVECFKDLVDINALFRPGTLRSGLATEYTKRKKGESEIKYSHPIIKEITDETYGIILYQEQIMQLLYNLGGLGWKTADMVRKVISKSQGVEQFKKFKDLFIQGCIEKNTLSEYEADKVFDELKYFGSYGFNKSHSIEYSLIAYWMMYMKIYYPSEFFESTLSWSTSEYKLQQYIDDMKNCGFEFCLVDIKNSEAFTWIINSKKVYPPFSILKGIGENAAIELVKFRKELDSELNKDSFENNKLLNRRIVNSRIVKILTESGSLSSIGICVDKKDLSYYSYSWKSDDDILKLDELFKIGLRTNSLDFDKQKGNNEGWYFGNITEIKFGYRQKVQQQGSRKVNEVEGTKDNLGGVYGYARDCDGGYGMITFDSNIYNKKKYEIEHAKDKYALFNGKPITFSKNILINQVFFEDDIFNCNFNGINLGLYNLFDNKIDIDVKECNLCELRKECKSPINSEYRSNVVLLAEAPGYEEDDKKMNLCGKAGKLLWEEFDVFNIKREDFSIINSTKCYPSITKTPNKNHLSKCKVWLDKELDSIKPILIFVLGKIAAENILQEEVKITELNNSVVWSKKFLCWIIFSIHPSSILRGGGNIVDFRKSIRTFSEKFLTIL